ncbi:thiol reductant ABC exporter subunit CydC [Candidatus Thiodictyon syntrophicum]|jgi:ATP-binding cassette subfamily C protein CydC|uniref:Thiol reductant ABC exporter subunit CydC n=1 Tax=Candidatus Thiodictyon syntrophicum TaxID=1166950 RepID=A0A2K8UBK9_9GAMM|nr:thiol reductant ABC exporter subunit CydC [Candidatus Thiodictyon syntrophicum]AUB82809.1 thiol reductant ABC exporter subunit CydC [Candidatus Thiodictyon syntrophicum]
MNPGPAGDLRTLARLLGLFAPYSGWVLLGFGAALVTLLANVCLLAVSGWFIAAMAWAGAAGAAINYFTPAALIRGSAMVRTGGRYLERLVTHEATLRLLSHLRVWFYRHLEPLAPARLQQLHSADLFSRIRSDIDSLEQLYVRSLVPLLTALAGATLLTLFLAHYDTTLALTVLAFLAAGGLLVPLWSARVGAAPGRRLVETESALREAVVDGVQALPELLVYGAAAGQAQRLNAVSADLTAAQLRLGGYAGVAQGALGLCANLALWCALWLAIPLVREGRIAPPDLAMLALLALAAFESVAPLPAAFQQLGAALTAARRLFAIVDAPPAVTEPPGPSPRPMGFALRLRGVRFTYPGAGRPALDGIDLELPAGRRIAVIGPSGSGKSTLFNLLLRFWASEAGEIRLGGHALADYAGEEVRRQFALVSQQTHLFNTSIRDNLLLARPDASQTEIEAACRAAQVHDFIGALPAGYDTWVGETGVRLSGGEARRIAVARAVLKDAPILLLDEPTEGLDAPAERALLQAVDRLMAGRTVLLVTHRPWGLEAMDEILVLDAGRITARGTYAELIAGGWLAPAPKRLTLTSPGPCAAVQTAHRQPAILSAGCDRESGARD